MTARYSQKFLRQYASAPTEVQKAFEKQIGFLLENLTSSILASQKVRRSARPLAGARESQLAVLLHH